jgi:hypothetical protein
VLWIEAPPPHEGLPRRRVRAFQQKVPNNLFDPLHWMKQATPVSLLRLCYGAAKDHVQSNGGDDPRTCPKQRALCHAVPTALF